MSDELIEKPLYRREGNRFVPTGKTIMVPRLTIPVPAGSESPRPVRQKTVAARAKAFLGAMTGGKVSEEVYAERLRICESNVCQHLRRVGEDMYCGACGCPRWRLAELKSKLWRANLECPCDPSLWEKIP